MMITFNVFDERKERKNGKARHGRHGWEGGKTTGTKLKLMIYEIQVPSRCLIEK
jgi:hypothetical protein